MFNGIYSLYIDYLIPIIKENNFERVSTNNFCYIFEIGFGEDVVIPKKPLYNQVELYICDSNTKLIKHIYISKEKNYKKIIKNTILFLKTRRRHNLLKHLNESNF